MYQNYGKKYFMEQSMNCAESVLLAANEEADLQLSPDSIKVIGAFGGGCGCGNLCGAIAGGCGAIARMYINDPAGAHAHPEMKPVLTEFVTRCKEAFGSEMCEVIKPKFFTEDTRCLAVVEKALAILDEMGVKSQY